MKKSLIMSWIVFCCLLLIAQTATAAMNVRIAVDRLNVRTGPGFTFSVQEKVAKGKQYAVVQTRGKWLQIRLAANRTGWVHGNYVDIQKEKPETRKQLQQSVVCQADGLRIRKGPGATFAIIGYVNRNEKGTATSIQGDWMYVRWEGKEGWVHRSYVTNIEQNSEQKTYVQMLYDYTNIRAAASTQAPVIAKAKRGDRFAVIRKEGQWYVIQVNSETIGYVAEWVVQLNEQPMEQLPPSQPQTTLGKTVVIDAGHGGKDYGATGVNGTIEKMLTLQTALLLSEKLKQRGVNVILTRADDRFLSLSERVQVAARNKADAFVSIHYDSALNRTANGLTIYYYKQMDRSLADALFEPLSRLTGIQQRGVRVGNYHVLRENSRPSVLLELGYLSHPNEELFVASSTYQQAATEAICNGLLRYFEK
ncbi:MULTISPECIES: N-acetylmuramoyl-L-alanine amidase [Anoxybacillus]|uniref:N-acetylmuramoyl-L-alanine amidase n=1 Tax=Anoxybacillus flavithermus AK1 TaxID=1297581 RepID=M8D620_9BACL|nr:MULTISPECIES: N-acetylmuramoyl-L-alanine amidase [Anoxybacillus]EMT46296.1 N-acetylmuramoyl-L-alanine amidase [Anoxybacillus flavithermus AK1]MBW7651386.1 N-acetylmuramoyl-L-alanine amidase [Anoxybacillus sp. ST4]